ncbi:MAG: tetratricopeptide repeat protein [Candidatus Binatales bacterium]
MILHDALGVGLPAVFGALLATVLFELAGDLYFSGKFRPGTAEEKPTSPAKGFSGRQSISARDMAHEMVRPDRDLLDRLQNLELDLEMANVLGDKQDSEKRARDLIDLVARIGSVSSADREIVRRVAGAIGNCAVELEKGKLLQEAESVYKSAIALFPNFPGLHFQYADYLIDARRIDEAAIELEEGTRLDSSDRRRRALETKLAIASGLPHGGPWIDRLRSDFHSDPGNSNIAMPYLMLLAETDAPLAELEAVCELWEQSANPDQKLVARRALADTLATRSDPALERKAVEIYQKLLPVGKADQRADILHNLGSLYASLGDSTKALEMWLQAYKLKPHEATIQLSLSRHLLRAGQPEAAKKVRNAEPVDEIEPDMREPERPIAKPRIVKIQEFKDRSLTPETGDAAVGDKPRSRD